MRSCVRSSPFTRLSQGLIRRVRSQVGPALSGDRPALAQLLGGILCRSWNTTPVIRQVICTTNPNRVNQRQVSAGPSGPAGAPPNEQAAFEVPLPRDPGPLTPPVATRHAGSRGGSPHRTRIQSPSPDDSREPPTNTNHQTPHTAYQTDPWREWRPCGVSISAVSETVVSPPWEQGGITVQADRNLTCLKLPLDRFREACYDEPG